MAGTYPAVSVEAAFGIDATAVPTGGDWVDISADVLSVVVETGRQSEWSGFDAGTAEILLDNADGSYDPDFAAGPYYGDLRPLTWVRVLGGTTTADEDVFYGLVSIEGWRVTPQPPSGSICQITVVDSFETLANIDLPESAYEADLRQNAPTSLWWLDDDAGSTTAKAAIGTAADGSYSAAKVDGADIIAGSSRSSVVGTEAVGQTVSLPASTRPAGTTWTLLWWLYRTAVPNGPTYLSIGPEPTFTFAPGLKVQEATSTFQLHVRDDALTLDTSISFASPSAGAPHLIGIVWSSGTIKVYVDGVLKDTSGALSTLTFQAEDWELMAPAIGGPAYEQSYAALAVFNGTALSAAQQLALYESGATAWEGDTTGERVERILDAIDWPSSLRSVEAGKSTMPAANLAGRDALNLLQEAETAEGGRLYVDHRDGGKVRFLARDHVWYEGLNLVVNPGAEVDTSNWTAGANTTLARTTSQAHSGAAAFQLTRTTSTGDLSMIGAHSMPVMAGRNIVVSAWFKAASTVRNVTVAYTWYDADGVSISNSQLADIPDSNSAWTEVTGTLTPPAGAATVVITAKTISGAVGEVHYVDDVYWYSGTLASAISTFGDGTSEVPHQPQFEDDRIINRAVASRSGGPEIVIEDDTSVGIYQRRSLATTGLMVEDDADVQGRAEWLVNTKADRERRVRQIILDPTATSHPAWAEVFARRIGDKITVKHRPHYGGGPVSYQCVIEGIRHDHVGGRREPLRTTFYLSPSPPPVFMWDVGEGWDESVWAY